MKKNMVRLEERNNMIKLLERKKEMKIKRIIT